MKAKQPIAMEPLAALPPACATAVRQCVARTGVPREVAISCCLGAISAAVGSGLSVASGRERRTRGNLYLVAAADSGAGKSEAFKELFGPILEFERGLERWWEESATPKAKAGQFIFSQLGSVARRALGKGDLPLEEAADLMSLYERRRGTLSLLEQAPTVVVDDATPQAVELAMARSGGALCWASPDARFLLRRLSKTDSREETLLLKSFSGDGLATQRITRSKTLIASPCLSCLLLSQPRAVKSFGAKLASSESGLLGRFLFAANAVGDGDGLVQSGGVESAFREESNANSGSYHMLLRDLLETFRFGGSEKVVSATVQASATIRAYAESHAAMTASASSARREILHRRAELAWRLALLLHAAREGAEAPNRALKQREAKAAICLLEIVFPPMAS